MVEWHTQLPQKQPGFGPCGFKSRRSDQLCENAMSEKIAEKQPTWVCQKCAEKYAVWVKEHRELPIAEYHSSMCDVCKRRDVGVTQPKNVGLLVEGWNQ